MQLTNNKLTHAMLLNDCPSMVTLVYNWLSADRHRVHPNGNHERRVPTAQAVTISIQPDSEVLESAPPLLLTLQMLIKKL